MLFGLDVKPSEPTEDGGYTAAVVIVLVFVGIVWVLCCIFVRCKKTKSGPEVRISLLEMILGKMGKIDKSSLEFFQASS